MCTAALALTVSACASVRTVESAHMRSVTTLAQVLPQGLTITGLAIEYDRVLPAGQVPADTFAVATTLCFEVAEEQDCKFSDAPRTVVSGYTSSVLELTGKASSGSYVILELDTQDLGAAAAFYNGTYSDYYELDSALTVTQIADWDLEQISMVKPTEAAFTSAAARRLVVDDFTTHEFQGAGGAVMPYRLFAPEISTKTRYPLVVNLHGHGESGTDNLSQIAGTQMAVAFADEQRQTSAPAFVVSPQTAQGEPGGGEGTGWWHPDWQQAVIDLIEQTIEQNPQIDSNRVYLTGLSMGAYGSWEILTDHSNLFAGAILVCGEGDADRALAELGDFPIWVTHSEDDFVVPYDASGAGQQIFTAFEQAGLPVTWSTWDGNLPQVEQAGLAQAAWDEAKQTGSKHIMTTFPAGTTPVLPHFSWIPTFENEVILNWLFSQQR